MIKVNQEECIGCGVCCTICPADALELNENDVAEYDPEKCIECYDCIEVCVQEAISKEE